MHAQQTLEGRWENLSQANTLSRSYATLLEALKPPTRGFMNDVRAISAYAPYVDAMFVDNECATFFG